MSEIEDLHDVLMKWFEAKGHMPSDLTVSLMLLWGDNAACCRYHEETIDKMLIAMKDRWLEQKQKIDKMRHEMD
jgi:hypothetical protein